MKSRFKIIICLCVVCCAALVSSACFSSSHYDKFTEQGQTVKISFDRNGGVFGGLDNHNLVDVYYQSDFENGGHKLVEPGDPVRGQDDPNALAGSVVSRTGYILAGWYRERKPREDEQHNMLDEYGEITTEKSKQGYMYSGKWDFENDKLVLEEGKEYSADEPALTLYAAWIPEFKFRLISDKSNEGHPIISEYTFNPETSGKELNVPKYAPEGGAMAYGNFPKTSGYTFDKLYSDVERQHQITETSVMHTGEIISEQGVAVNAINTYYTTLRDGEWFKIYTAAQLRSNALISGCYEIYSDLDFSETSWPAGFNGNFSGRFIGMNGVKKISGISITQNNISQMNGGIFARLLASAEISNISFENAKYNLSRGSSYQDARFGLLAGDMDPGCTINNVSVSGEITVGRVYANYKPDDTERTTYSGYIIGLVTGGTNDKGISRDNITCVSTESNIVCDVQDDGTVVLRRV